MRLWIFVFIAFVSETKSSSPHTHNMGCRTVGSMIMCPVGMQNIHDTQIASFGLSVSLHVSVVGGIWRTFHISGLQSKSVACPNWGSYGMHKKHEDIQVKHQQELYCVIKCVTIIWWYFNIFMPKPKKNSAVSYKPLLLCSLPLLPSLFSHY